MHTDRINRKTVLIIVPYAAAVIVLNVYLTGLGYVPLLFYTSVFWIAMPVFVYAAMRKWLAERRSGR